jgi:hypothetical protein
MNQREKSEALLLGLKIELDEKKVFHHWEKDAVVISADSPKSNLMLWIDTYSKEVSIGLADNIKDKTIWHEHVYNDSINSGLDEVSYGCRRFREILNGKLGISPNAVEESDRVFELDDDSKNDTWEYF